jgi:death on curing protein
VRDPGLLESALARPRQHYTNKKRTSLPDPAAIYAAGIVRNHPFVDGKKRTGFVIGVLFLELNGFEFFAGEEDAAQAMMELAAGSISE